MADDSDLPIPPPPDPQWDESRGNTIAEFFALLLGPLFGLAAAPFRFICKLFGKRND